jgi:hypothetical protein
MVKQSAVTAFSRANAYPVLATPTDEVSALIRKLHPRRPARSLVRLGPAGDGGYLVPDDLDGIEACFSPGVGGIIGFEHQCVDRGMKVFMADASVEAPEACGPGLAFLPKFVGAVNSSDSTTMDAWVESALPGSSEDLLLQIDIEGSEYETFLSMSDRLLQRFRIIVGEFHFLDQLWNKPYFGLVSRAFERIIQSHTCVHIHPNNCSAAITRNGLAIPPVMEFTFLRNDRHFGDGYVVSFPHPADADNAAGPSLVLPACWYRTG